jgi:hypothetical protein
MELKDLRPSRGADLAQLQSFIDPDDWRSVLPSGLSDFDLLALALDFRTVEVMLTGSATPKDAESMSTVLCVVLNLLKNAGGEGDDGNEVSASWDELVRVMTVYQWALEREVATRILGTNTHDAEKRVVAAFEACAR